MLDIKLIISNSVSKLLEGRKDISRLNLSRQMNVADGTLGRIKYGTGNPNIETVETIAKFFKFEAWQLLVENFDPSNPPKLAGTSQDSFSEGHLSDDEARLVTLFRQLQEPEKTYLLKHAIQYAESTKENNKSAKTGTDDKPIPDPEDYKHNKNFGSW